MNFSSPSFPWRPGAARLALLLLFASLSLVLSSCQQYVEVRRPIPGTGAFWVEKIAVYKRPRASDSQHSSQSSLYDAGEWHGDTMTGSPRMVINLGEQKVYFYKGGQLAGTSPISSGREGMGTVTGSFSVIEKDKDHASSLFGDYVSKDGEVLQREIDVRKDPRPPGALFDAARMPFFMRITGATGMHEGYLPGYPASHGCIRLPHRMAEIFFRESSVGTPIKIVH
ncbi:L,D-transpeptidase family protein [Prosthecobacter sp.]|uniref:L,D-transpeptidase family protein n=1 Tax=Prosthecobacter sp. TaxID=1965333 RepID=UPI003784E235